jgi:hypothetical protein
MKATRREFVSTVVLAALGCSGGAITTGVFNAGVSRVDLGSNFGIC